MIRNEKRKWLNILLWLASVGAMIGLMILGGNVLKEDEFGLFIEFLVITVVSLGFLYLISGKKTFTFLNNQTGYTVRMLLPTLILSVVFCLMGVINQLMEKQPFQPNWPVNLLFSAANMFLVGVYEETCFRACACDALLPVLKKLKHPFLLTAVISGLVFGYVHVVSVDFTDIQQVLQFVLKISNTAIYGGTLMILYWKTRNLLGLAIIHGLNDFLLEFLNHIFLFENADNSASYTSGETSTTMIYLIQLAFEIAVLLYVYKKVGKTLDYKKIAEEW